MLGQKERAVIISDPTVSARHAIIGSVNLFYHSYPSFIYHDHYLTMHAEVNNGSVSVQDVSSRNQTWYHDAGRWHKPAVGIKFLTLHGTCAFS